MLMVGNIDNPSQICSRDGSSRSSESRGHRPRLQVKLNFKDKIVAVPMNIGIDRGLKADNNKQSEVVDPCLPAGRSATG